MDETTALERRPKHEVAKLSTEMKTLIRDTWFKGASEQELRLAYAMCERLRLDPFARQIHFIKIWDSDLRREVMQPVVAIQGVRAIAEETGLYRGLTDAQWCGTDGQWVDVWLDTEPPAAARIGVKREGFAEPVNAVARFESYCRRNRNGELGATWKKMPDHMISKCAEALAFRKAFPGRLSGVYTNDEMDHMVVDGGELSDVKSLPDGKSSFGFKRRQDEEKKVNFAQEEANLRQLIASIDAAQTEDELNKCTVNGDLDPEGRAYAATRWKARREEIRKAQGEASEKGTERNKQDESPKESTAKQPAEEPVQTDFASQPDPWVKRMAEDREKAEQQTAKETNGKKEKDGSKKR
jgi:phage recombination protein Bet